MLFLLLERLSDNSLHLKTTVIGQVMYDSFLVGKKKRKLIIKLPLLARDIKINKVLLTLESDL